MLSKLFLYHFKNYTEASFDFSQPICCFYGPNGAGKTNILDAIYYLSFTKSYFSSFDHQVIQKDQKGMYTKGIFDKTQIDCIIRENGKKEVSANGKQYERYANHIGKYPAVIIAPDDIDLINGYSDTRRRFIDILLCQLKPTYLSHLVDYNKYLAQRNALLKSSKSKAIDSVVHNHYKTELCRLGTLIYQERKEIIEELTPLAQKFYSQIANNKEKISISYKSQLSEGAMHDLLDQVQEKDFATMRTNVGIHKDDLQFEINSYQAKNHSSQGQKKSFLFAIKFAEFALLKKDLGNSPILLLDDIFEKLDVERSQHLVNLITELDTQVFITDTHKGRLTNAFEGHNNVQFESIK